MIALWPVALFVAIVFTTGPFSASIAAGIALACVLWGRQGDDRKPS